MKAKNSNKVWGIKSLVINGARIHTICVRVNSNSITLDRVINHSFWKDKHTLCIYNGISKVEFTHTTMDINEAIEAANSLNEILFAHKIAKDLITSYGLQVNKKQEIVKDVLIEMYKYYNQGGYLTEDCPIF